MKVSKVMVSGCFDALHPGHIAFLESAAHYGELHVCLGSDQNVFELKNRKTYYNQFERAYMLNAVKWVKEVRISKGFGQLDFIAELSEISPDYFVVNGDGHSKEKQLLVESFGVQYIVLNREPKGNMPARSTTQFRKETEMPFRIDLAGGWLDQPFVSALHGGAVITISILPSIDFNSRSGMASSTRSTAMSIWGKHLPNQEKETISRLLFAADNPPGKKHVSGSQDAIGIVYPGINRLSYQGGYWPEQIDSILDENLLTWLEDHLFLIPIGPRQDDFEVLDEMHLDLELAKDLANAAEKTWDCLLRKDLVGLGEAMTLSFKAQCALFPLMTNASAEEVLLPFLDKIMGYKISGAGGGGYWVVVSEHKLDSLIPIKIRRN